MTTLKLDIIEEQILNKNLVVGKKFIKSNDTIYRKNFLFKEVNIVNSQFKFYKNNLIINSGSQNGVVPKMGLIGTKGVIGIVTNVTNNYATVRPIINPDFGLKILHQKTNAWGDLLWAPCFFWNSYFRCFFVFRVFLSIKIIVSPLSSFRFFVII